MRAEPTRRTIIGGIRLIPSNWLSILGKVLCIPQSCTFCTMEQSQLCGFTFVSFLHFPSVLNYASLSYKSSGPSSNAALPIFHTFNTTEAQLSSEALRSWISFVINLSPTNLIMGTKPSATAWTPAGLNGTRWVFQEDSITENGTVSFVEGVSDAHKERCAFWSSESVSAETGI